VTDSSSVVALYPHFVGLALASGLGDFDTAALKGARARQLTQAVASWLYEMTDFDGVTFASRHGDDLQLCAILERPGDPPITPNIHDAIGEEPLQHDNPEISNAFRLLGLQWETD
jgi:hypothetical protein